MRGRSFFSFLSIFFFCVVLSNLHCSPPTDQLISKADTAPLAARYSTVFTVCLCLKTSKHSPACSPRTPFTPVTLRLHVKQQKAVGELADDRRPNTGNLLKKPLLARRTAAVTQVANTTQSPSLLTTATIQLQSSSERPRLACKATTATQTAMTAGKKKRLLKSVCQLGGPIRFVVADSAKSQPRSVSS